MVAAQVKTPEGLSTLVSTHRGLPPLSPKKKKGRKIIVDTDLGRSPRDNVPKDGYQHSQLSSASRQSKSNPALNMMTFVPLLVTASRSPDANLIAYKEIPIQVLLHLLIW